MKHILDRLSECFKSSSDTDAQPYSVDIYRMVEFLSPISMQLQSYSFYFSSRVDYAVDWMVTIQDFCTNEGLSCQFTVYGSGNYKQLYAYIRKADRLPM